MNTTLLKHEWLRTRGTLGTVVGIVVLITVLAGLLALTDWPLISDVGLVLGIAAILLLAPGLQLILVADYWRSSYGRTGYFTQSLPVRGSTIYTAKLIWALLVTLAALVVTLALIAVLWIPMAESMGANPNPFLALRDGWVFASEVAPTWMIIGGILLFLAMYLIWPIQYYFSVSVGHEAPMHRFGVGGPILIFVLVYVAVQVAYTVGSLALPFGVGLQEGQLGIVSSNFLTDLTAGSPSEVMPLGFLPPMLLIVGICLWRTMRSWNRKVSLT